MRPLVLRNLHERLLQPRRTSIKLPVTVVTS